MFMFARFVNKCCPGMTLEEFNVFRTMKMLETGAHDIIEEEEEDEDIEGDNNFYTVPTKSRDKIKYDPNRLR